jgi:hypothetical protein
MMRPMTPDARARRGLWLAFAGIAILPLVLLLVAILPSELRAAAYLGGLAVAAAVSIWGGLLGRGALVAGTDRSGVAIVAAMLGLIVGVTLALLSLWGLLALFG